MRTVKRWTTYEFRTSTKNMKQFYAIKRFLDAIDFERKKKGRKTSVLILKELFLINGSKTCKSIQAKNDVIKKVLKHEKLFFLNNNLANKNVFKSK